jgi:hypothetical protein
MLVGTSYLGGADNLGTIWRAFVPDLTGATVATEVLDHSCTAAKRDCDHPSGAPLVIPQPATQAARVPGAMRQVQVPSALGAAVRVLFEGQSNGGTGEGETTLAGIFAALLALR